MKSFTEKDICIIIPTYNRSDDVNRTLKTLFESKNSPGKIIVVDQSKDDKTKKVVKKFASKFNIEYVFSKIPSSSIAENIGVERAKKKYSLLLICGDDLDFYPDYLKNLAKEFDDPKVMGAGGADIKTEEMFVDSFKGKIASFALKCFFLPHNTPNKFKVVGPYGNTISHIVRRKVSDAQWVPGFNNCFRREVYNDYKFMEYKGYNVLEDIDCSYNVYKKFGKGSLVISPDYKVYHRYSTVARYPEKKRIFINHEDHFAFFYKYFNNFSGRVKMVWSILGISLGNVLRAIFKHDKESYLKMVYNFQAIAYSYKNRKNIKAGKLRNYLDENLNLKPGIA